jgi:inorganic pyrophosphatase
MNNKSSNNLIINYQLNKEKNIIKRMFNAFDVLQHGYLEQYEILKLCKYLELDSNNDLFHKLNLSFDDFWIWWIKYYNNMTNISNKIYSSFSNINHQHELIIQETGTKDTVDYRINYYFYNVDTNNKMKISPWHDIPLQINKSIISNFKYNFICEIPKWTRAKFEIATDEIYNPIKQDTKNGNLRFYQYGDMMWNYGAFPQTWESTEISHIENIKGDNDPLDGIDIGMVQYNVGKVYSVKILGVIAMIDNNQMDWKIICISESDPIAHFINDISDVYKYLPGCLEAIRKWLRVYKICQGEKENTFAFNGEYKDKIYATKIIEDSHNMWANLHKIQNINYFKK